MISKKHQYKLQRDSLASLLSSSLHGFATLALATLRDGRPRVEGGFSSHLLVLVSLGLSNLMIQLGLESAAFPGCPDTNY